MEMVGDIDIQTPRFVIFYRQSKLEKHAADSWDGDSVSRCISCEFSR